MIVAFHTDFSRYKRGHVLDTTRGWLERWFGKTVWDHAVVLVDADEQASEDGMRSYLAAIDSSGLDDTDEPRRRGRRKAA